MKKILLSAAAVFLAATMYSQETETVFLSGKGSDSAVEWDFFCTAGRNSGRWTRIPVPSNWEFHGFGQYTYGHMPLGQRLDESGIYRYRFNVPASWKGKKVDIVFGGAMTDTKVMVNGRQAGPVHRGGYYEFRHDISGLLRYGKSNSLEVTVDKSSSDESIVRAERQADFWVFGGIYRPVSLEARPASRIERLAIDARADGSIAVEASLGGDVKGCKVVARVTAADGTAEGLPFETAAVDGASVRLESSIAGVKSWSAEFPTLYTLELSLMKDGRPLHRCSERFGFRTVETRPSDGIYLNGEKIKFRGVDRHSFWPTSGRAINDRIDLEDALLIKEMNMNAVRCSHYPPTRRFLDVCDSLGIYVIDELTGWQDAYDTEAGRPLVKEMILRDVNHPSVLMWANGNEGGFNFDLLGEYAEWDIQKRQVIHPWLEGAVINNFHYPSSESLVDYLAHSRKIWFPTEFNHGLYDGGHGAGLEDFWEVMQSSPLCAGGFLWDFSDQGVVRDDEGGRIDTDGNHGADGILGPFRQKEGSFYAIRDIWSPIQLEGAPFLAPSFEGRMVVENRYNFTNLSQCGFKASFISIGFPDGKVTSTTVDVPSPDVEPGLKGMLRIPVPDNFKDFDVMEVSASGPDGRPVCSWTRNIGTAAERAAEILASDSSEGSPMPVSNIRFVNDPGKDSRLDVRMLPSGWTEVDYSFAVKSHFDNVGVTFDFPEETVTGMRWLGNGPYRVWKNRLRGVSFGLWEKKYNDTATGESWDYPEFKGYHSNMYAADIRTTDGILRIVFASDDLFLRLFTPAKQEKRNNDNTLGVFPDGQISVLNAISPVGTKFSKPELTGPQGEKNYVEYMSKRKTTHADGRFYMKFIATK